MPEDDGLAPLEAPLLLEFGATELALTVPAMVLQPLPDVATPLVLGAGVELTVGHDVLAGTLGAASVGAADLDPASLDGWARLDHDAVAAWATSPLATPSVPLDVRLSVEVPDGTYELVTSGFEGWTSAGTVDVADGEAFHDTWELTDNLVGEPFEGELLTVDIPADAPFEEWNLITVWCVPFAASFGAGVFGPPE